MKSLTIALCLALAAHASVVRADEASPASCQKAPGCAVCDENAACKACVSTDYQLTEAGTCECATGFVRHWDSQECVNRGDYCSTYFYLLECGGSGAARRILNTESGSARRLQQNTCCAAGDRACVWRAFFSTFRFPPRCPEQTPNTGNIVPCCRAGNFVCRILTRNPVCPAGCAPGEYCAALG